MDLEDVPRLRTRRLELVAATPELARAALSGNAALAAALDVSVPEAWPPPGLRQDEIARALAADASLVGWSAWYVIEAAPLVLVGAIGFSGHARDGAVDVGFDMLAKLERRGFAAEALGALIDWAFAHEEVRRVRASAPPASARVMEQNGLRRVGDGEEPGMLRFELARP